MGASCSSMRAPRKELTFLVIGLDNSGKTTLTRTINGDIDPFIVPTVGFAAPVRKRMGAWDVVLYDLGGGARIRGVWPQYFADVHGVVFVVDSRDASRLPEAARELHAALQHPMIVGKPTLIFANKADLADALSEDAIVRAMGLDTLALTRHTVVRCSAVMSASSPIADTRIALGLSWLLESVGSEYTALEARRVIERREHKAAEEIRRKERLAVIMGTAALTTKGGSAGGAATASATTTAGGSSASVTTGTSAGSDAPAAAAAAAVPMCTSCKAAPAKRRSAASKWEAVCEACAVRMEKAAAAVAAAEEEEEEVGGGGEKASPSPAGVGLGASAASTAFSPTIAAAASPAPTASASPAPPSADRAIAAAAAMASNSSSRVPMTMVSGGGGMGGGEEEEGGGGTGQQLATPSKVRLALASLPPTPAQVAAQHLPSIAEALQEGGGGVGAAASPGGGSVTASTQMDVMNSSVEVLGQSFVAEEGGGGGVGTPAPATREGWGEGSPITVTSPTGESASSPLASGGDEGLTTVAALSSRGESGGVTAATSPASVAGGTTHASPLMVGGVRVRASPWSGADNVGGDPAARGQEERGESALLPGGIESPVAQQQPPQSLSMISPPIITTGDGGPGEASYFAVTSGAASFIAPSPATVLFPASPLAEGASSASATASPIADVDTARPQLLGLTGSSLGGGVLLSGGQEGSSSADAEVDVSGSAAGSGAVSGAAAVAAAIEAAASPPRAAKVIAAAPPTGPLCSQCNVSSAERRCRVGGEWCIVCGPCGEAIDAGKPPPRGIFDALADGLAAVVAEGEEGEPTS